VADLSSVSGTDAKVPKRQANAQALEMLAAFKDHVFWSRRGARPLSRMPTRRCAFRRKGGKCGARFGSMRARYWTTVN
jgi:hypothetical protein